MQIDVSSSPHHKPAGVGRICDDPHAMTVSISSSTLTISSRNHHHIKRIRRLYAHQERERTGLFYVEGLCFVAHAIQHCAKIEALVVCRPLLKHPYVPRLIQRVQRTGALILDVTPDVFLSLSQAKDPQGIGAIVHQSWEQLVQIRPEQELCWIALQMVRSPGNLGTLLRTSDAVGGAGIILLDESTDPYDPSTVRATMGAVFRQRFVRTTVAEFRRWKRDSPYRLVGTSPSATTDYHMVSYDTPTILLMGEERKGLPPELQSLCDMMVSIPMVGEGDSLNLAVATSVMLYEMFNQKRDRAGPDASGVLEKE
ncbi:MAG TPA: RNA methyltransferase [Ktedonobacteraceae bacterium]|nr:RNA methyltransferase [Ktedonobacteraceae bacterium]